MFTILYGICLIIAAAMFIYMAQKNYYNIDIYHWTMLVLIPVILMSYWLKSFAWGAETAGMLLCFLYLESTILITVLFFSILHTLDVEIKPWIKILAYGTAFVQLAVVCTCVHTSLYYSSVENIDTGMGYATKTVGGPLMFVHYIYLFVLIVWMLILILISRKKAGEYSRKNLLVYMAFLIAGLLIYFIQVFINFPFSFLPFLYAAADVLLAVRYDYAHRHDISYLIAEKDKNHESRGFVAIGLKGRYLTSNAKSRDFLPFLNSQRVNEKLSEDDEDGKMILDLIDDFNHGESNSVKFNTEDMTCVCEISYFSIRKDGKKQGYLLDIRDATEEQRAYDIVSSYNDRLNEEVVEKTNNIKEMQRKIVLGMANMIENRDNNTGGHVKRTSDIIHILVDEIIKQGNIGVDEQMALDIVRAAPTHDLGKISIDSNILNKPSKLTDEEYEIMKTHSTKSGEMVMILLDGVEEERFVKVAYNVARYHHERWDGRGYPEGLVGTMIPLEARIMAVADVYDALVSKRVYKEPMSFEESASIMCECMGTQFDPNMRSIFIGAREKLEEYYRVNGN